MPSIHQAHINRSVNRTVTLPAWLNADALERNFSQMLQDALKTQLHLGYDDTNTVQVKLKLNRRTDADVIQCVNSHKVSRNSSAQGAIKALIRADIADHAGTL